MNNLAVNGLQMTLEGLNLEKYLPLLEERRIQFDTFVCMTREDFEYIGITNKEDVEAILNGVTPLKALFKEINNLPQPKLEVILANILHDTRPLLASLKMIKRKLKHNKPENVLLDTTCSANFIVYQNLKKIDNELENLKKKCLLTLDEKPQRSFPIGITVCLIGCITAVAVASIVVIKLKKS